MEQRAFVTFDWTGVPKQLDGEDVPGGRPIMEAVRQAMQKAGYDVAAVEQHDWYGWYFETTLQDVTVWSMLQYSEPWLVISEAQSSLLDRLRGRTKGAQLGEVCEALHKSLVALGSASSIQWFTRTEYQRSKGRNGAATPSG